MKPGYDPNSEYALDMRQLKWANEQMANPSLLPPDRQEAVVKEAKRINRMIELKLRDGDYDKDL